MTAEHLQEWINVQRVAINFLNESFGTDRFFCITSPSDRVKSYQQALLRFAAETRCNKVPKISKETIEEILVYTPERCASKFYKELIRAFVAPILDGTLEVSIEISSVFLGKYTFGISQDIMLKKLAIQRKEYTDRVERGYKALCYYWQGNSSRYCAIPMSVSISPQQRCCEFI